MRIETDPAQIAAIRHMLSGIENGINRTLSRALNATLKNVQTRSVKEIGQQLNLNAARIKKDFIQIKANPSRLDAILKCKSKPPGLINFQALEAKKGGVSFKKWKKGKRETNKDMFIVNVKIGKDSSVNAKHVAIRKHRLYNIGEKKPFNPKMKYGKMPKKYRMPIKIQYGPRVSEVYRSRPVMSQIEPFASERIAFNLDQELERELRRYA